MASRSTSRIGVLDKWLLFKLFCSNQNLNQSDKVAAFWLLDHFNSKTHLCNPKLETLAREMNVSVPTAKRSVKKLEAEGCFIKTHQGGRNKGSNHYWPCFHLIGRGPETPPIGDHQRAPSGFTHDPQNNESNNLFKPHEMQSNDIEAFECDNDKTRQEPSESINFENAAPLQNERTDPPHEEAPQASRIQDDGPKPMSIARPATTEEMNAERVVRNEASESLTRALLDQDMSGEYWLSNEEFSVVLEAEIKEKGSGVKQVRAICVQKMGKGSARDTTDV